MLEGIDCKNKKWRQIPLGRTQDLTGQKFDYLNVKFRVSGDFNTQNKVYWLCQCDCGKEVVVEGPGLRYGRIHSCGCYKRSYLSNTHSANLIDKTFNYLTVVERVASKNKKARWKCKCKCGNYTEATTSSLVSNKVKSCGCLKVQNNRDRLWIDLSGQKFNHLLALNRNFNYTNQVTYDCLCDCGKTCLATADDLRSGHKTTCGCKKGRSIGEEKIYQVLVDNNISFLTDVAYFKDLHTVGGGIGRYDFIIFDESDKPIRLIEFDGIQHYEPTSFYYKETREKDFNYTQANDRIKTQYALEHKIPLVRIPYWEKNNINLNMLMGDKYLVI